jgi:hypothetical protein
MRTPLIVALLLAASAPAAAQLAVSTDNYSLTISGRINAQFRTNSVDSAVGSRFILRRARVTVVVRVDDLVEAKIQPDFGEFLMRDAYVRLNLDPAFELTFGNAKRAFDRFELYSSSYILAIERTGKIEGVEDCAGVGGVCSWSQLTEKLEYSDRDLGVHVGGEFGPWDYGVSVTNGSGAVLADENDAKSFSGRLGFQATPDLHIAANLGAHDYLHPTRAADEHAVAYGGDIEWGAYLQPGVHVQAGFLRGQNWKNLDAAGDPSTFTTAQAMISYRSPIQSSSRFEAVEPVARVSWADPDKARTDNGGGWLLTPGVAFHLSGRNMLVANVDGWFPTEGDVQWSLKMQAMVYF